MWALYDPASERAAARRERPPGPARSALRRWQKLLQREERSALEGARGWATPDRDGSTLWFPFPGGEATWTLTVDGSTTGFGAWIRRADS